MSRAKKTTPHPAEDSAPIVGTVQVTTTEEEPPKKKGSKAKKNTPPQGDSDPPLFFVGPTPKGKLQAYPRFGGHVFTDEEAIKVLADYKEKHPNKEPLFIESPAKEGSYGYGGGIVVFLVPYRDEVAPLSALDYEALKEDIAKSGVQTPVLVAETWASAFSPTRAHETGARPVSGEILTIIDGHHRIRALCELLREGGLSCERSGYAGDNLTTYETTEIDLEDPERQRERAVALNVLRRQLSPESRAELILKYRLEGKSLREIAERVGVSKDTVSRGLSAVSPETPEAEEAAIVTGKDGKKYSAKNEKKRSPKGESIEEGMRHRLEATTAEEDPDSTAELRECWRCGKKTILSAGQCAECTDAQAQTPRQAPEPELQPEPTQEVARDKRQDYCTDLKLITEIQNLAWRLTGREAITLDPCTNQHAKTDALIGFTEADDGLSRSWREECATEEIEAALVYVNPPFNEIARWLEKCVKEDEENEDTRATNPMGQPQSLEILVLLPVRTDTDYWQSLVFNYGAEILWLKGRQTFWLDGKKEESPFRFPCALVYYGTQRGTFADWARERGLGAVR